MACTEVPTALFTRQLFAGNFIIRGHDSESVSLDNLEGMITFTYYDDLEKAAEFFGEVMGFELVIDLDFAKVY